MVTLNTSGDGGPQANPFKSMGIMSLCNVSGVRVKAESSNESFLGRAPNHHVASKQLLPLAFTYICR